jgi:hypothetical protein
LLLLVEPLFAFDTPLSRTGVREAYFLGQRHDDSLARLLSKYVQYLPAPQSGPYIQSVSFLTPYVLAAINASERVGYSAQQAQIDHDKTPEVVRVAVQIWLTDSYGPYTVRPTSSDSHAIKGFIPRPGDFWRDFRLRVFQKDEMVLPVNAKGQPTYRCEDDGCILTGAMMYFEFPADSFTADTVTVVVTPPEGEPVPVDFDPASFR